VIKAPGRFSQWLLAMSLALLSAPSLSAAEITAKALEGSWRVVELAGRSVDSSQEATLAFKDGRVAGKSFCNRYSAAFEIKGQALVIGPAASTKMACMPSESEREALFFDVLRHVASGVLTDRTLTLKAGDGRTIMAKRM
jgi:heat shock protein HslJ